MSSLLLIYECPKCLDLKFVEIAEGWTLQQPAPLCHTDHTDKTKMRLVDSHYIP